MATIDEARIASQLNRIISDATFTRSQNISRLLTFLVTEELAGRGERLKGYTVGVDGLGKAADFDPSNDASVRVETGRLRRMLTNYFTEHDSEDVLIEIPKGSYRPRFSEAVPQVKSTRVSNLVPSTGPSIAILPFDTTTLWWLYLADRPKSGTATDLNGRSEAYR